MFSFRTTPLEDQLDRALLYGKVGCFCTQNCWDTARSRWMYDIFRERGNLAHVFNPREAELTPGTNHIEFDLEQIRGLDAVVVEIQDVGVRYFNYTKDVMHLMEMLKLLDEESPSLYIVDHINPSGRIVEGTIPAVVGEMSVPKVAHRHGLTLGELCNLYSSEISAKFPIHVISAMATDANRQLLPWTIAPASDLPGLFSSYLYSGGGLWNNTTVTPGIGTARPYEYIGAPFIKPGLPADLPQVEGALLRPCSFTPSTGRYAGQWCFGLQIMLVPGEDYHSLLHTLQLMRWLTEHYSAFEFEDAFWTKLADPVLEEYLKGSIPFDVAKEHIKVEEQKWIRKAKRYLLYEDQPFRMK
ncbi:MAG: DUF1343 domain-containing protein [Bacteroidales bacterium]|nr:DUF1343 domain-containing protein [Bacteroidales bacterium]